MMITIGLTLLAIGALLYIFDWPRVFMLVPYTEPRHHWYERIVFAGWLLLFIGVLT